MLASWIQQCSFEPPLLTVQSRDQRHLQVLAVDLVDGSTQQIAEDRDDTWVELVPIGNLSSL